MVSADRPRLTEPGCTTSTELRHRPDVNEYMAANRALWDEWTPIPERAEVEGGPFLGLLPVPGAARLPYPGLLRGPGAKVERPVEYGRSHSMGEIVTAIAEAGLRIELLREFPFTLFRAMRFLVASDDDSRSWRLPAPCDGKLPLMFSLKAIRPAA